ncbi:peptide ABC transporter ATP-binding protein [Burkholderia aenigmatica]|uniref:Peptide ABC transporter ATP-binding protein n=1 Tax=Burkholderia aenigmatica TaxID=2015348 RepID=A0A6P2GYY1_9BURK|nr:oligopeptide/dipeptide ABC transporter ATP-binding protein [Burkholderia aenigmatica]VWB09787.1 peptide ABC transporter ATP-binding protein [Burkholderia aenigmatica]
MQNALEVANATRGVDDTPVLCATGLGRRFRLPRPWPARAVTLDAVNDVSLSLARGRTLGIVGESGCGKSTLSRMLVGILAPSEGTLRVGGVDVSTLRGQHWRAVMRDVQMVFQSPYTALNPRLTIGEIVREPLDIHEPHMPKGERDARAVAMLERVGLHAAHAKRYPFSLSGGQLQRVGIARALVRPARAVICDEPVSALDVSVQAQVVNLLRELQDELAVSYVFVSHDLAVVANVSHDIAVMYMGRVVESGRAADVLQAPRHPYTQALVDSANAPDPHTERSRQPRVLAGELPRPTDPPSGCRFRTRCWMARAECAQAVPALVSRSGSPQKVACHFA